MRQNVLPILEAAGVDLVLSGHSHSYERSYLLNGHYGQSNTLTPAMIIDNGSGNPSIDNPYQKEFESDLSSEGTVYITSGSAGKTSGGALNHPAMYASFNQLGSCILDVDSNQMRIQFLNGNGFVADEFLIEKVFYQGVAPEISMLAPLDEEIFPLNQTITLEATATDADGSITSVEFIVNGVSAGTDNTAPYQLPYNLSLNGDYSIYAIATDDSANVVLSDSISVFAGSINGTQTIPVVATNDDVEEYVTGVMKLNSSDLEFVRDPNFGDQLIGIRFLNVEVPIDAVINQAYIQFTTDETTNINPTELVIFGEAAPNSSALTSGSGNLSNRRRTRSILPWLPPNWNVQQQSGINQRTVDISNIIEEIVAIPGWESGNAITLMITGWGRRTAESFDGTDPAELFIDYTFTPSSSNTVPEIDFVLDEDSLQMFGLQTLNVEAESFDSTGTVVESRFYVNGSLTATDNTYPFQLNWTPTDSGNYVLTVLAEDDEGNVSEADSLFVRVDTDFLSTTTAIPIAAGNDDAEEDRVGNVNLNESQLQLVAGNDYATGDQTVGLRFVNLPVDQGAKIYQAWIQFQTAANYNRHPIDLRITGHESDDAPVFQSSNGNIAGRARTDASVNWQPAIWTLVNQNSPLQRTPDLRDVIQEIIDRPGWQKGNALALLLDGTGGRTAWSFEGNSNRAAVLHLVFEPSPEIVRGPYLQRAATDQMTVRFRTDLPVGSEVHIGPSVGNYPDIFSQAGPETEHEIVLTGLSPQTQYFYQVLSDGKVIGGGSSDDFFYSAPTDSSYAPVRAWILGDPGTANNNARAVRNAYYTYTGNQYTDLMIMLGDNAYNDGTDAQYQQAVFENMYEDLLKQTVLFPCPGNHEFYNGGTDSPTETGPYYDIFSLPRNAESGGLASGTEAYYSYDYGNVHFISLDSHDSDRNPGSAMLTWLQNDLAATIQEWIVVYFHHPPYTKGSHNSDNPNDSGGRMHDMREH
ncbi:MAG: Ig-like domain-containing protein, partial [Bacteroidota bacterium]